MDRIDAFWAAVGALTYAELQEVAAILRDACDADYDLETTMGWMGLLNAGREVHDRGDGDEEAAA